jgi:hypothetical protein
MLQSIDAQAIPMITFTWLDRVRPRAQDGAFGTGTDDVHRGAVAAGNGKDKGETFLEMPYFRI